VTEADPLLVDEDRQWQTLHEVFARIPAERFEEPGVTPDGWSPKDVMFHVGAWMADCACVLEQIHEGTFDRASEDTKVTQDMNRRWFELSRTMDPKDVRAGFGSARLKMRECFAALPAITPDAREWFEESGPIHYRKHVDDLEAWLG
jgi:Mycothiol maleylpyruvate isomerase N-terminal domain